MQLTQAALVSQLIFDAEIYDHLLVFALRIAE
jgi:hypothetical protein